MASNQELVQKMALDLGLDLPLNRRPTAKLIWQWLDLDLLPHSSLDTYLGELYSWNGRNFRTSQKNIIGVLFSGQRLSEIKQTLIDVEKYEANVPDFEFSKEDIIDLGFSIPALFDIKFKGDVQNAKNMTVKVNGVTKSRLTNIDSPGIEILSELSLFSRDNSKEYRQKLKREYIATALFYAESVEIELDKEAGVGVDFGFAVEGVDVNVEVDTEFKKVVKLKYSGAAAPFAASLVKVKDWND